MSYVWYAVPRFAAVEYPLRVPGKCYRHLIRFPFTFSFYNFVRRLLALFPYTVSVRRIRTPIAYTVSVCFFHIPLPQTISDYCFRTPRTVVLRRFSAPLRRTSAVRGAAARCTSTRTVVNTERGCRGWTFQRLLARCSESPCMRCNISLTPSHMSVTYSRA